MFRALTTPASLDQWFTDTSRIEARRGGEYRFAWSGGYLHEGRVLAFARSRLLVLEWPQSGLSTRVRFSLTRTTSGTLLEFRQSGVGYDARRRPHFLGIYGGWLYYLTNLRALLEAGHDLRRGKDRYW